LHASRWHIPWMLPPPPEPANLDWLYMQVRDCVKQHLVFKDDVEYDIYTLWVMATWLVDYFDSVPYLLFRGEIESGKTRALEVAARLAYHAIPTVGLSPPVLRKQIEWFRATCLIDQAEDQLNRKYETGQEMYRLVAAGYKRGMYVARCRKEDPNVIDYDEPFGFKAFASTSSFDTAIDSRSIIIDMEEAEPPNEDIDEALCAKLRGYLLYWRLTENDVPVRVETRLKGRTREIMMPLLCLAEKLGIKDKVERFGEELRKRRRKELTTESKRAFVFRALLQIAEGKAGRGDENIVYIWEIKERLKEIGWEQATSTGVGKILKDMGFEKESDGRHVYVDLLVNAEKIEYWKKKYEIGVSQ